MSRRAVEIGVYVGYDDGETDLAPVTGLGVVDFAESPHPTEAQLVTLAVLSKLNSEAVALIAAYATVATLLIATGRMP